jgi:hypothetical protein
MINLSGQRESLLNAPPSSSHVFAKLYHPLDLFLSYLYPEGYIIVHHRNQVMWPQLICSSVSNYNLYYICNTLFVPVYLIHVVLALMLMGDVGSVPHLGAEGFGAEVSQVK